MPNWSVKATAVQKDTVNNNGNLIVTFTATNSVTGEVVTRLIPGSAWTANKANYAAESLIVELNSRDTALANANTALPNIQAFVALNQVLATG